jgi:hypothetical protein
VEEELVLEQSRKLNDKLGALRGKLANEFESLYNKNNNLPA